MDMELKFVTSIFVRVPCVAWKTTGLTQTVASVPTDPKIEN